MEYPCWLFADELLPLLLLLEPVEAPLDEEPKPVPELDPDPSAPEPELPPEPSLEVPLEELPLEDAPLTGLDVSDPEERPDLAGLLTVGSGSEGTVTVAVGAGGSLTGAGIVTVIGVDGTVTVVPKLMPNGEDALLVSGWSASGTMNPSAAATPAMTQRRRLRARSDGAASAPNPVRGLNLPGIAGELLRAVGGAALILLH